MTDYTIVSSKHIDSVEEYDEETDSVSRVPGTELTVTFTFDLAGEEKSETQTYRFPTQDVDEVKIKLAEALECICTSADEASVEDSEEAVEEVEGLEAGTSKELAEATAEKEDLEAAKAAAAEEVAE